MSDLIDAYMMHLAAAGCSSRTITARSWALRQVARCVPHGLDQVSPSELEEWLSRPGWAQWTRYTYYEHLLNFFRWAAARGHLDWNPMEVLRRPRTARCEPRPVSEEELAIALDRLTRPWRIAVLLAAFAGLRCAEVARARREDITVDWIPVLRKGGSIQMLPTHPRIWAEIELFPPGLLIPMPSTGGRFAPSHLSGVLSARLSAAGLPSVTLHRFRHRFATRLLLPVDQGGAGADIRTVQELMGHASLASTQIYTQVTDQQRRAAIARLVVPLG